MSALTNVNRRSFLRASAAAAGGLLIGFHLGSPAHASPSPSSSKLNAFVHVGTDDIVTLFIHKAEMGQGTVTSLSMLLAEELECDWKKIRTEFPGVEPRVRPVCRAWSAARASALPGIRCARPAPRRARCWCRPRRRNGALTSRSAAPRTASWSTPPPMRELTYGSLAEAASKLPVPANVALKDPRSSA